MQRDVHTLDLVERGAHLLARHRRVTEEIDEFLDRMLEVHVVLPERVVAVDQEELAAGCGCHRQRLRSSLACPRRTFVRVPRLRAYIRLWPAMTSSRKDSPWTRLMTGR